MHRSSYNPTQISSKKWAVAAVVGSAAAAAVPAHAQDFWIGGSEIETVSAANAPQKRTVHHDIRLHSTSAAKTVDSFLLELMQSVAMWAHVYERIGELSSKNDGWKGEGSLALTDEVAQETKQVVKLLSLANVTDVPSLGLDYEGSLSLFWQTQDLKAELSVYGDGTYSYFARRDAETATADEADINLPMEAKLLSILTC